MKPNYCCGFTSTISLIVPSTDDFNLIGIVFLREFSADLSVSVVRDDSLSIDSKEQKILWVCFVWSRKAYLFGGETCRCMDSWEGKVRSDWEVWARGVVCSMRTQKSGSAKLWVTGCLRLWTVSTSPRSTSSTSSTIGLSPIGSSELWSFGISLMFKITLGWKVKFKLKFRVMNDTRLLKLGRTSSDFKNSSRWVVWSLFSEILLRSWVSCSLLSARVLDSTDSLNNWKLLSKGK